MYGARQLVRRLRGGLRRNGGRDHRRARAFRGHGRSPSTSTWPCPPTPADFGTVRSPRAPSSSAAASRRPASIPRSCRDRSSTATRSAACASRVRCSPAWNCTMATGSPCSRSTTTCLIRCGATVDDTEGLVNLPLAAREVVGGRAVQTPGGDTFRVSLRSKGAVDVRAVADRWGGGGHRNAAGCTMAGPWTDVRDALVAAMGAALVASIPAHAGDRPR